MGSALPRNPSSVPESLKCILCGVQEALRALQDKDLETAGAHIILVTQGAGGWTVFFSNFSLNYFYFKIVQRILFPVIFF